MIRNLCRIASFAGRLVASASIVVSPLASYANPTGGVVSAGQAAISSAGNTLNIHQQSNKVVIDWRNFDINAGETTQFHQPGADSIALNRVNSTSASQIHGNLVANGNVVILNQNGVLFGSGARVDVNGLIATTAGIANEDFMQSDGPLHFNQAGNPNAAIVNHGAITAAEGGLVGFVAPNVANDGVIAAKAGRIHLASGDTATVDFYGDGLMEVAVSDAVTSQIVANNGIIAADGGTVAMTAAAGKTIVNSLIVNSGVLRAQTVGVKDGEIIIAAAGSNAVQGNVASDKGKKSGTSTVLVSGLLDASGRNEGERGGAISVLGDNIALLDGALLDASGYEGLSGTTAGKLVSDYRIGSAGGDIRIGGDYLGQGDTMTALNLYVDEGALILNDALHSGDAGRTIFWSDNNTYFYGNVYARALGGMGVEAETWHAITGGHSGDGGFVETSGHNQLDVGGYVDLTSSNGARGTYFLDPTNITIYGNFAPDYATVIDGDGATLASNLKFWVDSSDTDNVQLTYASAGTTTTGATLNAFSSGTQDITVGSAANLKIGARVRFGSAGAVTAATTAGDDTYVITNIVGTTVTLESAGGTNTANYGSGSALYLSAISQLTDKSSSGNNAVASGGAMPLWISNGVNGLGAALFNGSGNFLATQSNIGISGAGARSLFSVANLSGPYTDPGGIAGWGINATEGRLFYLATSNGGSLGNFQLWIFSGIGNDLTSTTPSSDNTTHLLGGIYTGTDATFLIDGTVADQNSVALNTADGTFYIGKEPLIAGSTYAAGYIPENILYNTDLSENAQALVNQYQAAKWGGSVAGPGTCSSCGNSAAWAGATGGVLEALQATAATQKGDSTDGFSVFTTRYLEHLSESANISLQASNNIVLDLKSDNLNFATAGRSLTLTAGNQITTASAGTITTNNGAISLTGTSGGINFDHDITLNTNGGNIDFNSATVLDGALNINAGSGAVNFASTLDSTLAFTGTIEALLVGGGGGGGRLAGGGGGGGGVVALSRDISGAYDTTITIGAGGAGAASNFGGAGGDSGAFGAIAYGGGGGGYFHSSSGSASGLDGGSGGGAGAEDSGTLNGGTATAGVLGVGNSASSTYITSALPDGWAGLSGNDAGDVTGGGLALAASGGGGAGAASSDVVASSVASDGGAGIQSNISGSSVYYAGGGGGGAYNGGINPGVAGDGGAGGGGGGSASSSAPGDSGTGGANGGGDGHLAGGGRWAGNGGANTGGGGGGGSGAGSPTSLSGINGNRSGDGGNGGSGVVIVRYESSQDAAVSATGATTTTDGDYTVLTFNGDGNFETSGNNCGGPCALTVNAGSITFGGAVGGTGALGDTSLTSTSGNIAFNGTAATTGTFTANAGTGNFSTASTLSTGSGAVSITADTIALGGNLTGTGALALKAATDSTVMRIGGATATDFHLSSAELGYINNGSFSGVTYGSNTGTGNMYVGAFNPAADTTLLSNSGDLQFDGNLTLASDKSLTITSTSGNISASSNYTLATSRSGTGGNVTMNTSGNIDLSNLKLLTGNGDVSLTASGTGTATLRYINSGTGDLSVNAYDISLVSAALPSSTPLGYWALDEGTGAVATDGSGNSNTGTIVGGASYSTSTHDGTGYSLDLSGGGKYITVSDANSLDIAAGGELTQSLWIYRTSDVADYETLITKRNGGGVLTNYEVSLNNSSLADGSKYIVFYSGSGITLSTIAVPLAQWTLVTTVSNASNTNYYINGVQAGSASYVAAAANTLPLQMGGQASAPTQFFDGMIDDVRLDGTAFSASEVSALYYGSNWSVGTTNLTATHDIAVNLGGGSITSGASKNITMTAGNAISSSSAGTITAGSGADLTMTATAGALNVGNLTLNAGNAASLTSAGTLTLGAINAATIFGRSTGAAADIVLTDNNQLTASGAGEAIVLAAGRSLVNNNTTHGANTLNLTNVGTKRWVVYSSQFGADTKNGLSEGQQFASTAYASTGPGSPGSFANADTNTWVYASSLGIITLTAVAQSVEYGSGANLAALLGTTYTFSCSDGCNSSVITSGGTAPTLALTDTNTLGTTNGNQNAGTWTIGLSGASATNGYLVQYTTADLTVTPKVLSLSGSKVYDGDGDLLASNFGTAGSIATGVGTETLNLTGTATISSANVAAGSQGLLTNALSLNDGTNDGVASNYTLTGGTHTAEVTRAQLTVAADSLSAITYGDANPTLTYGITGYVNSENATSAGVAGTAGLSINATQTNSHYNAGTWAISVDDVTGLSAANYSFVASSSDGALTVNKAQLTVTADAQSRAYGAANPTFTQTISGFVNSDTDAVVSGSTVGTSTANATSGVGDYAIVADATGFTADNYTFVANSTDGVLTIGKAQLTVKADNLGSITYGDANPALTYGITGYVNGEDATSANVSGTAGLSINATQTNSHYNAGSWAISVNDISGLNADNYDFVASGSNGSLTVGKATLTVTAGPQMRLYGDANPTFTQGISGYVNGDDISVVSGTLGYGSSGATGTTGIGTYSITANPTGLSASNYYFVGSNGVLTIDKAHLTVTANDISGVTYGDANPTLSYTVSGFKNSETTSTAAGYSGAVASIILSTDATQTNSHYNAGTWTISVDDVSGFNATNYDFTANSTDGTMVIDKAVLTVAANSINSGVTYGDANPTLTYGITGYVNSDNSSVVSGTATVTTNATQTNSHYNAGTWTTDIGSVAGLSASNYSFAASGTSGALVIDKAQLTVTADVQSRLYGDANPALTQTISGYVNGDTLGVVSGTAYGSTAANATSGVGGYAIVADTTGLSANNYTFVANASDGTLTIGKAHLTVTADSFSRTTSESNPTFTQTISGFKNGEDFATAGITGVASATSTATDSSPAGSYTILADAGSYDAANYDFTTLVNGVLTVSSSNTDIPVSVTRVSQDGGLNVPPFRDPMMPISRATDPGASIPGSPAILWELDTRRSGIVWTLASERDRGDGQNGHVKAPYDAARRDFKRSRFNYWAQDEPTYVHVKPKLAEYLQLSMLD